MIEIKKIHTRQEYGYCAAIRAIVFLEEQNCEGGIRVEYDEFEEKSAHYVLLKNNEPIATARYRVIDDEIGKIERIAVLREHRGKGYGRKIVEYLTNELKDMKNVESIIMSAQDYALKFYNKLGYETVGEGYFETGIPHHKIEMKL